MLKKSTKQGTVSASTFENSEAAGITIGRYGKLSCVSLEGRDDGMYLLINDDMVEQLNIKLVHTNIEWKIKGE